MILPTYGERLGLRGKIARNWTLNPHPTLIPAIESGWVESVHCFGGEPGMDRYTAARPDVFFTGSDGSLRSNRVLCQLAGQYAIDMFIGSSLQIDGEGNSSTVTDGRLSGFGGAPNMGHDPHGRLVWRTVRPAREVSGLVSAMLVAEPQLDRALRDTPLLTPRAIADMAVAALRAEAQLTPKPGLVDRRGSGVHTDMNLEMLLASADALHEGFAECATAAQDLPLGTALRARVGVIGRTAEHHMLAVTGGINTHRGALWSLGLLAAGVVRHRNMNSAIQFAAALAMHPDPGLGATADSHGARARRRYGASGAIGEAQTGFPHVVGHALPTLRRARSCGADETTARLDALLAVIAHLADTCLLHRGGLAGLRAIRRGARRVLAAGGSATPAGRRRLAQLDDLARTRRLSPGGSGDLLSAALFLDSLSDPSKGIRTTMQTLTYRFPADRHPVRRVHVGVVASGDLEILLDPPSAAARHADVRVRTSVNGFDTVWHDVLARFFARTPMSGRWELNDFGATPGVVTLRLGQVAEAARADSEERP